MLAVLQGEARGPEQHGRHGIAEQNLAGLDRGDLVVRDLLVEEVQHGRGPGAAPALRQGDPHGSLPELYARAQREM